MFKDIYPDLQESIYLIEGINPKSMYYGHMQLGTICLSQSKKGMIWMEHEYTECNPSVLQSYTKNKKQWRVTKIGDL